MSAEPNVAAPRAKWIVTTTQSRELVIVNAPNPTWVAKMTKLRDDNVTRRRSARYHRRARTIVRRRETLVSAATSRCAYSTATSGSAMSGTIEPLHSGQSGQASPAPMPRTVPPKTMVAYARIAPRTAKV